MFARFLALICLSLALLSACTTPTGGSYPATPTRSAMIERVIDHAMMGSRIGTELQPDRRSPQLIARQQTAKARAASRFLRPDAYWQDFEAIELSYATLLSQTETLAQEAYRKQMHKKLSYASDEDLLEFINDQHLLDNSNFLRTGRKYDLILEDYANFRRIYPENCLQSYMDAMAALARKYPTR